MINQFLLLDSGERYLGIVELEDGYNVNRLKKFFTELLYSDRLGEILPSLEHKIHEIDIWNGFSIDVSNNNFSVCLDIYGDDGIMGLKLIPLENINTIKERK